MQVQNFSVLAATQEFSVDSEIIHAFGDPINPYLKIPIEFKLLPPNNKWEFILTDLDARIVFPGFKHETSRVHKILNRDVFIYGGNQPTTFTETLEFPLDQNKIKIIEINRKEDVRFVLNLDLRWGIYTPSGINTHNWTKRFVSQYGAEYSKFLQITINQSHWVKQILPQFGYSAFKLIEVPVENELIPKEYKDSLAELDMAKKLLDDGYSDKVVAHCRNALEPLKDTIMGLKQHIPDGVKADWIETMIIETNLWLNKITAKTKKLSSEKTHHYPTFGHFDRTEAQIIYMITVGIIGYVGKVSSKQP